MARERQVDHKHPRPIAEPVRRACALDAVRREALHGEHAARLAGVGGFLGASALAQTGNGEAPADWRHGLSLFGELKYPADFKHFDYVNPQAPKAGTVRLMAVGTFDNFNEVVAGLKGSIAAGTGM